MLKTFIFLSTAAFTGNMSLITVHRMSVFHVAGVALLSDSMPWLSADLSSVSALSPRHSIHIVISGTVASSFRFLYLHTPSHSFSLLLLSFNSHQSSPEYVSYVHHMRSYVCMGVCGYISYPFIHQHISNCH